MCRVPFGQRGAMPPSSQQPASAGTGRRRACPPAAIACLTAHEDFVALIMRVARYVCALWIVRDLAGIVSGLGGNGIPCAIETGKQTIWISPGRRPHSRITMNRAGPVDRLPRVAGPDPTGWYRSSRHWSGVPSSKPIRDPDWPVRRQSAASVNLSRYRLHVLVPARIRQAVLLVTDTDSAGRQQLVKVDVPARWVYCSCGAALNSSITYITVRAERAQSRYRDCHSRNLPWAYAAYDSLSLNCFGSRAS